MAAPDLMDPWGIAQYNDVIWICIGYENKHW